MGVLNNARLQATQGPTTLSRHPVVRFQAAAPGVEIISQVQAGWDQAVAALAAALELAGIDPRLVTAPEGRPAVSENCAQALGDLLARLAASFMQTASAPGCDFGYTPAPGGPPEDGEVQAYWNNWMQGVGLVAGRQAFQLLELAFAEPERLPAACPVALKAVYDARVDPFFYQMVRAAEARDIPWRAARPGSPILAYGQGARQQWFHGTMSNRQGRSCVHLTMRKHLSVGLLRAAGLPVPEHRLVKSVTEAAAATRELGFPLVVKPDAGSRAENIFLNLTSEAEVVEAATICFRLGQTALVEKLYDGLPYRITVCGGKAVAAARHAVPYVVGDGTKTVAALIDEWNRVHGRAVEDHYRLPLPLKTTGFLEEMTARLKAQQITLEDVPAAGREVFLARVPSLQKGGIHVNMMDQVHPDTLALAEEAARILHTGNLGVDFITTDFSRPHDEVPLVINEVNAAASSRTHIVVPERPRDLSELLFAPFFPPGDSGRIPIAATLGGGLEAALQALAQLLTAEGETVGQADSTTARIGDYRLCPAEGEAAHPGFALLRDKRPSVAVMSFLTRDVIFSGLPSDRFDVVAVTADLIDASREGVGREALKTLVGLPGEALVLPSGGDTAWLAAAGGHRRLILVDAGESGGATAPSPAGEITRVAVEGPAEERRLTAFRQGGRDPLGRPGSAAEQQHALAWAAALLLGLGRGPLAISRSITALGIGPSSSRPAGGASA